MKTPPIVLISSALLALALYPQIGNAQIGQEALREQVLSSDVVTRTRAVEAARALGPANTGSELRAALITALEREAGVHTRRYEAGQRGEILPPIEDPELIGALSYYWFHAPTVSFPVAGTLMIET